MTLLRGIAFFLFHANEEITGKYIFSLKHAAASISSSKKKNKK
jgi:hypothetical protein